jgi:DNA/RNA-binding domain of Phe-tRNA-synthetase-like protein
MRAATNKCGGGITVQANVRVDSDLKKKCPRTALGCVTAHVQPGASPVALLAEMNQRELEIQELPYPRGVLESPQVETTRKAYKALGKDPARYRGSAEALLRRIVAGKGFPQVNVVVDIINLVSVESRLPVGLYDLAHVTGEIVFRAGRAGETYKGIGKYDLNLEGLPVFADNAGPHGSATSDSERTMVTPETKEVLAIIISFGGPEPLDRWTKRLSALLAEHAAAQNLVVQVQQ